MSILNLSAGARLPYVPLPRVLQVLWWAVGGRGRDHRTILPVCWCIDFIWRNVNFNIF